MKLHEIDKRIEYVIENSIDPETGEILDESLFAELDNLSMARDEKVENLCLWYKNLLSDADQLKQIADGFYKRQKAAENRAKSLKEYIGALLGGEKFKTLKVSVWYKTTKNVVDISIPDEELADKLPERFQRKTIEANKTALKEALLADEKIDGCKLIDKESVVIK